MNAPATLPAHMESELTVIAERIRSRVKQAVGDIIEIGNDLNGVKARLPHGTFLAWISNQFGWPARTAQNYMRAAEWVGDKNEIVAHLPSTTIYKLAAPTTPEAIKAEVLSDLARGHAVDPLKVEERIREAAQDRRRLERDHRHRAKLSPATQKRRDAEHRRMQDTVAEQDNLRRKAAAEIVAIFERIAPADRARLQELVRLNGAMSEAINLIDGEDHE